MLRPIARRGLSTFKSQIFLNQLRGRSYLHRDSVEKAVFRVRVQQRPTTKLKHVTMKLIRFTPFLLLAYYIIIPSIEILDEDAEKEAVAEDGSLELGEGEEDDEAEDEEDGVFFPVTWPKLGPKEFYRGTDPEWQEYIKLSKNKERQGRIFAELVRVIREMCGNSNASRALGTVDMTKGRHWIDVIFPPGPPRHYEQIGIEFTGAYIALSRKELSEHEYHSMKRWFNPSAVLKSVMATCAAVFGLPADRLKNLFGSDNDQKSTSHIGPMGSPTNGRAGFPAGVVGFGQPNKGATSNTPTQNSNPNNNESSQNSAQSRSGLPELPGSGPGGTQSKLLKTFLSTFNARFSIDPPRGTIILSGLVECIGTRASTTVDVVACYDLINDQFILISPKIRRLSEYQQRPRGR